jgi:CRP-like cAMP-binding protein
MRPKNLILAALPEADYKRLMGLLERTELKAGDILHRSDSPPASVYFLEEGVASLSVSNSAGLALELSIVGNEGTVGERAIFEYDYFVIQCTMITDGCGYKMSPAAFKKEFYRTETLHDIIINNLEARITETSLTALCNQTHLLEKRLSRWLLTLADRSSHETIVLTHEAISNVLAVSRTSLSQAAEKLQDKGMIRYSRGVITIIDRAQLEKETCECYAAIKEIKVTYLKLRRRAQAAERRVVNRSTKGESC